MYGVRLRIFGEYACFTRPEMKSERVSYDVPTPSALRGVLEAIHWKPAIVWRVDAVHVMKPVKFENIRRNELGGKVPAGTVRSVMKNGGEPPAVFIEDDRQQRAALILKDVEYYVEAHFDMTDQAGPGDSSGKHLDIFNRRLLKGQVYHQPCLGCREFAAHVEAVDKNDIPTPAIADTPDGNRDLGWMLYDLDYGNNYTPMFFRARLDQGILRVPAHDSPEVRR